MFCPPYPFFMVRHGETSWNREGRFQGQTDIELNDLGRTQAWQNGYALRELINSADDWTFVSSPLSRTRVTMELIRDGMGLPKPDYSLDERLIEVTFGDWERFTLEQIADKSPDLVAARNQDKWNFVPPNGESYSDAAVRVKPMLSELTGPTVIVTHGGIIRATRHLIEEIDPQDAAQGLIPQDQLYFYDGDEGGWLD